MIVRFHTLRTRARYEEGFGLLELMISLSILLVVMMSLVQVITSGLLDVGLARQRQGATGLASQLVEQARGLAFNRVTQVGLEAGQVAGDPRIATTCADGVARLESCDGEQLVISTYAGTPPPGETANSTPLWPHRVTETVGSTQYTRAMYVTHAVDSAGAPTGTYRVTAIVTWALELRPAASNEVRSQTLLFSPDGCRDPATHPYAAPCVAFFSGKAVVPQARVEVAPTPESPDVGFLRATLLSAGAETDAQVEQIARVTSIARPAHLLLDLSDGTRLEAGDAQAVSSADTDSSTSGEPAYSSSTYPDPGPSQTYQLSTSDDSLALELAASSDRAGNAESAVSASSSAPCPIDATEIDELPCAHARAIAMGALEARTTLGGSWSLVKMTAPTTGTNYPGVAKSDRERAAGVDVTRATAERKLAAVRIFDDLSTSDPPDPRPEKWKGYLIELRDLVETVQVSVGEGVVVNPASPTWTVTGVVEYWSESDGDYLTVNLPAPDEWPPPDGSGTVLIPETVFAAGEGIEVKLSGQLNVAGAPSPSCEPASCSGSVERAQARTRSPISADFTFRVVEEASGLVTAGLSVRVDLGSTAVNGIYIKAPEAPAA